MSKYEVRMKATFYYDGKTVKNLTMIDIVEALDMVGACKAACRIQAALSSEFTDEEKGFTYGYEELVNHKDVDDLEVEISAIVPFKDNS